jgi:hypothetical protein
MSSTRARTALKTLNEMRYYLDTIHAQDSGVGEKLGQCLESVFTDEKQRWHWDDDEFWSKYAAIEDGMRQLGWRPAATQRFASAGG